MLAKLIELARRLAQLPSELTEFFVTLQHLSAYLFEVRGQLLDPLFALGALLLEALLTLRLLILKTLLVLRFQRFDAFFVLG